MLKAFLAALVLSTCVLTHGFEVTDQRGVTVTFAASPKRVVTLLPSLTETVCALGQCAKLVGVDRYSNHPQSVKTLPKLGGGIDPSIEAVFAQRPDVVLIATSARGVARLEALGLKVLAFEPKTHAEMQQTLAKLSTLFAVPEALGAQAVWGAIEAGVVAAAQSLTPEAKTSRVYFEVNRGPYGAGASSFVGETLARLGVRNIVPPDLGPFPRLNPEFIVQANPDVIMVSGRRDHTTTDAAPYPGWASLAAVRAGRVCTFDAAQSDVLVRAGPRLAEAAQLMARCLNDKAKR